jgi:hypothetical protein
VSRLATPKISAIEHGVIFVPMATLDSISTKVHYAENVTLSECANIWCAGDI